MDDISDQLPDILGNRRITKTCVPLLVTLNLMLSRFDVAKPMLEKWGETEDLPIAQPRYLLHLGDCELGLGNRQAAKEAFERAVAVGIETVHARTARERLASLG